MQNMDSFHKGWGHDENLTPNYEVIKVRCPQCFQAFRVNAAEIKQSRPKFACTKCQASFWLPFPEALKQKELIGFPVSWIQVSSSDTRVSPSNIKQTAQ
ncbi:MAG: zinc-ribbon domain-containing protein, partial [Bdellovibrionales bacterium]|nr:zinc-ribbon domain-containing protein [Bdellovibrionales bacterium]